MPYSYLFNDIRDSKPLYSSKHEKRNKKKKKSSCLKTVGINSGSINSVLRNITSTNWQKILKMKISISYNAIYKNFTHKEGNNS